MNDLERTDISMMLDAYEYIQNSLEDIVEGLRDHEGIIVDKKEPQSCFLDEFHHGQLL